MANSKAGSVSAPEQDGLTLRERLDNLWPPEVQRALDRERAGETLKAAEQVWLLALVVGALSAAQDDPKAAAKQGWVEIKLVGGRLRCYRCWRDKKGRRQEYIGDVGR